MPIFKGRKTPSILKRQISDTNAMCEEQQTKRNGEKKNNFERNMGIHMVIPDCMHTENQMDEDNCCVFS